MNDPRLPRNVRLLLGARAARSVGQGAMVVSFALYLHALGYSGAAIGVVLMAGLLFGALLTLIVGPLSDRRGRRGLLLAYECTAALAALAAMLSRNEVILIAAATIAGFGRGANGAAGPFAPVEQAWLAREVSGAVRRRVFSLNATVGFIGMAAGAGLAALPSAFGGGFGDIEAYRLLFLGPLIGSLVAIALLGVAREAATASLNQPARADELQTARAENRQLRRLAATNAANGLGIGIVGPLIAYWFARRFGQGPGLIGPVLAAGFLLGAVGSGLGGRLSVRIGPVRSVVWMRCCGLALLLAIPFAQTFGLAAGLYALRGAFNRGTIGARQSVAVELTRVERRGLAASVQSLSLQIPRAAGPVVGGWMIHAGAFVTPFLLAAALQAAYLLLYRRYFGALDHMPRSQT
ncbi:MAG TPA: MFS transporter [Steroidobacteraceae bacterium]|nr:MFS transporter [Steroidobacteraceae bacterium]